MIAKEETAAELRKKRGLDIATRFTIDQSGEYWLVPSQAGQGRGKYVVKLNGSQSCNCLDHVTFGIKCKHIYAAEKRRDNGNAKLTETVHETEAAKRTYSQNWPAYNAAQVNEKDKFQDLLLSLCSGIADPPRTGLGRPRLPLDDAIFSAVFKVYSTLSGRRFMSDLRDTHRKGYIGRLPCYNSIFNILESKATTPILKQLVVESAMPLKPLESHFAVDSSGFSASKFDRWFDHKHGTQKIQRAWVKAHIMTGVKSNVIVAVEILGKTASDTPLLPVLLNATAERFNIEEVSGDLAYSSRKNLQAITDIGATPLIPFKQRASGKGSDTWAKLFHYFSYHKEEFLSRYHLRSNVETTFSMVKAKFGDSVRSKNDTAMMNEVLAKFVCHNICCVIQAMYELGIDPTFWAHKKTPPCKDDAKC